MNKEKIETLLNSERILLFMKGDKYMPKCGFSSKVVEMLDEFGVSYTSFDILEDEEIRQELKEYSKWPTYPQLYINAELIGGCDIITELYQSGELEEILNSAK